MKLKKQYTKDSIFMDIMEDPDAVKVLQPILDEMSRTFGAGEDDSEVASEAISAEMNMAMMRYMPLRGVVSFAGGGGNEDMLANLLKALNSL